MIRVVLDTNVLVSALLSPSGKPAEILRLERNGQIEIVFSPDILMEHWRVLSSQKIRRRFEERGVSFSTVELILKSITRGSIIVPGRTKIEEIRDDPSDNMFLACAVEGEADCIISGDRHLKALESFEGIPILDPAAFLERVSAGETR